MNQSSEAPHLPESAGFDPLLQVILSLLTPLLMAGGITDTGLARQAALQAIAACNGGDGSLVTIAQIVGFAIAALDNLRLSADPDLSLSMKLRLRGNANALHGSGQRSTAALASQQPNLEDPNPIAPAAIEPPAPEAIAAEWPVSQSPEPAHPLQPAPDPSHGRDLLWASAMTDIAAECSRNLGRLPPAERRAEIIRINALKATARQLARGETGNRPSDPAHARQHPAQQPVPQHKLMVGRPQHVQSGNRKQDPGQVHVNIAHLMPPS